MVKLNKIGSFNCDKAIKTNDIHYILVEDRMLKSCSFTHQWKKDKTIKQKRSNEKNIIYTRI